MSFQIYIDQECQNLIMFVRYIIIVKRFGGSLLFAELNIILFEKNKVGILIFGTSKGNKKISGRVPDKL